MWVRGIIAIISAEILRRVLSVLPLWVSWAVVVLAVVGLIMAVALKRFPLWALLVLLAYFLVLMLPLWIQDIILWVLIGILGAILGIFLLILPLRMGVMAQYSQDGPLVYALAGPVRVKVYPRPEKGPRKKEKKKEKSPKAPDEEKPEKGGAVDKLKAGLSIIGPIMERVRRRLVISELTLHYTVVTDDAAKTAFLFGGAHVAVSQILPMLRYHFRVKKQDVQIGADFDSGADRIFVRVKIVISVWGALCLGLYTLIKVKKSGLI